MKKKPIDYYISPAKGQALLNFQGRRMPDKIEFYETSLIEEVSQNGQKILTSETELNADFKNLLIHGDCLSACAYLKNQNIKVDLVYIDPPFASGANYAKKIYLRTGKNKTPLENDIKEIGEEIMYGDIWQKEDYLNWFYERILAIKEVMSENASIFVHLDATIGHYAKILLDEIFGEINFQREIVWRIGWVSGYKTKTQNFIRNHDVIYYYLNNTKERIFNKEYIPYPDGYTRRDGAIPKGKGYPFEDTWNCSELDNMDSIQIMSFSSEKVDYNTQKNENLIERILKSCSNKGMILADFFGGSGTTAKVANDLGRKFITCDIGVNAVQTSRDRLVKAGAEFDVLKINDGVRLFRNPEQTTAKLFSLLDGFKDRAELGLSEFWDGGMMNKRGTFTPVKFIGIDKKLTQELVDVIIEEVIGLEDTLQEEIKTNSGYEDLIPAVKIIYAYKHSDVDQDSVDKSVKSSKKTGIKAELVSLDEILSQKADVLFTPDNAVINIKKEGKGYNVEIKEYFSSYLKNKIDDFNNKKVKGKQTSITESEDIEEDIEVSGLEKNEFKSKIEISKSGLELIESVQFDTTLRKDGVWTSNLDLEDKAGVKEKIKAVYKLDTNKFKMKIRNISGDEIIIDSSDLKQ